MDESTLRRKLKQKKQEAHDLKKKLKQLQEKKSARRTDNDDDNDNEDDEWSEESVEESRSKKVRETPLAEWEIYAIEHPGRFERDVEAIKLQEVRGGGLRPRRKRVPRFFNFPQYDDLYDEDDEDDEDDDITPPPPITRRPRVDPFVQERRDSETVARLEAEMRNKTGRLQQREILSALKTPSAERSAQENAVLDWAAQRAEYMQRVQRKPVKFVRG